MQGNDPRKLVRYRKLSTFLRDTFGSRVHKVGLWGGFDCPNRDGTLSASGCSFCNPESTRPASLCDGMTVMEQLESGCEHVAARFGASLFLPYFQDYTTTYSDPADLFELYSSVLSRRGVIGLSICTRPDCLADDVLDVLERISRRTFLWVELGVQTFDDSILADMNRCHTSDDTRVAFEKLHRRGINTAGHMILGYPGATAGTAAEDARQLRMTGTAGVKLQNFHVVKGTEMERRLEQGRFRPLDIGSYLHMATVFLEQTDPGTIVLRLTGQASREMTVAPDWSLDKGGTIGRLESRLDELDTWQGRSTGAPRSALELPVKVRTSFEGAVTIAVNTRPE